VRELFGEAVEFTNGDLADCEALSSAAEGAQIVFHFGAVLADKWYPREYMWKVNVEATRCLADASKRFGVERFIHISTAWVYGINGDGVLDETSPIRRSGFPYCDSKVEAEGIVRARAEREHLPAVIVQPSQVYGPGSIPWTKTPIDLLRWHVMVYPNKGRGLVQPIYIADLIEGIMSVCHRGKVGEAYLLCGPEVLSIREYFGHYAEMLGRRWVPSVPYPVAITAAKAMEVVARTAGIQPLFTAEAVSGISSKVTYTARKAERELGFAAHTTTAQGMTLVKKWIEQNHGRR
jgi:nucleoside-diphosphate-sugar epimerase